MNRRNILLGATGLAFGCASGLGLTSCSAPSRSPLPPSPLASAEQETTIAALAPPRTRRPVIAVLGDNAGSETTDLMVPLGVLRRAALAEVVLVATGPGPITLHPSLVVAPDDTIARFDARHPEGPDYVIVPALHRRNAPIAIDWIRSAAARGATIVGICAGALTLAHAGLLEGRRGVTHWYSESELKRLSPGMIWQTDRRYVADRGVATTTGVSASLPVSFALVEAIAGRDRALALSAEFGLETYDARHNSSAFNAGGDFYTRAALNRLSLFGQETIHIKVNEGFDEVSLALTADAWSRTYRSKAVAVSEATRVQSRNGVVIRCDDEKVALKRPTTIDLASIAAGDALPTALRGISARYGSSTARFVALQLEYPWQET
jgi:putative intracellular protease/amidase